MKWVLICEMEKKKEKKKKVKSAIFSGRKSVNMGMGFRHTLSKIIRVPSHTVVGIL